MELPFYTIILIYIVGLLIFSILSILDVYHLVRFESFNGKAKAYIALYVLIFIVLVVSSFVFTAQVDWLDTFNFLSNGTSSF